MFKKTTLLSYYKSASQGMNDDKIISIINGICTTHFPEPDKKFQNEIIEFVEFFKTKNNDFYIHNQDALIFKMYSEIIKKMVDERREIIHNNLPETQKQYATTFVNSIFSLNINLVCVASTQGQTYMKPDVSLDELNVMIEYLLFSKNAVLLFNLTSKAPSITLIISSSLCQCADIS